jgi:DNA-binding response OmpR family regulator
MNVLVVDDDKDLLDMVSLVLRSYAIKVDCLDNGGLVFNRLATHKPDVVLMDIYLGDADGRELCKKIKTMDEYQDIPVILYSAGNITTQSIQESLANDFISKPFDISHLLTRIRLQTGKN